MELPSIRKLVSDIEANKMISEPLITEQYRRYIQQIIKEVDAGETISHEDLKKESETW